MESAPNPFLSTGPKYTGPPMISCVYSGRTTYEQRLSTYPASWYTNTRCPDPAVMAQAGLFRISSPDRMYLAGCSECDFGTAQWDKDPFVLHVKNSPNCPLILRARKEHQASQAIAQSAQSSTSSANQRSAQVAMQPAPQVAPQAIIESCTQLATPSIAELEAQAIIESCTQLATPSIAELEAQAIIESYTQLATQRRNSSMTQEATLQADPITAYEEVLRVAIATPLPQAVECRRCLAEFSSNSKLHRHVRESHGKKIPQPATSKAAMPVAEHSASESAVPQKSGAPRLVDSEIDQAAPDTTATAALRKFAMPTIYSVTKSIAPLNCSVLTLTPAESTSEVTRASARSTRFMTAASASKSQPPPKYSASSLLSSETTSSAAPLRSVTPPSAYRAPSPSPPAYQAAPKNYLTVADLYVRYAPLKSMLSTAKGSHSATQKTTVSRAYLTVQDLYEKFGKKPHSSTVQRTPDFPANRIRAFNSEQVSLSTSQASSNDKSMGKNTSKAMHSVIESPATSGDRIGLSAIKSACDSKSSAIDFFQVLKTRFFAIANPNAQRLVTQQQRQMTSSWPRLELYPIAIEGTTLLGPKCLINDMVAVDDLHSLNSSLRENRISNDYYMANHLLSHHFFISSPVFFFLSPLSAII